MPSTFWHVFVPSALHLSPAFLPLHGSSLAAGLSLHSKSFLPSTAWQVFVPSALHLSPAFLSLHGSSLAVGLSLHSKSVLPSTFWHVFVPSALHLSPAFLSLHVIAGTSAPESLESSPQPAPNNPNTAQILHKHNDLFITNAPLCYKLIKTIHINTHYTYRKMPHGKPCRANRSCDCRYFDDAIKRYGIFWNLK